MSKKLGKVIAGLTAAAAVGAGVYYWFKKKDNVTEDDFEEEDFEEDFELDEDLEEVSEQREYVSLTPNAESKEAEETSEEAPAEEIHEEDFVAEETEEAAENNTEEA